MTQYPQLEGEALHKLPPMIRELIQTDRKLEPFKAADVLTMDQCRTYKKLIDEKNRIVQACNNTYGKVSNVNGNNPSYS